DAGGAGCFGNVLGLGLFLVAREVFPEVRDGINAVGARESLLQALDVVEVRRDRLRALIRKGYRLVLARIPRYRAARELTRGIAENRATEAATLGARRT